MSNLSLNQFSQGDMLGRLDQHGNPNTFSAIVHDNYTGDGLVPGQAVKVEPFARGTVRVLPVESETDQVFGFVTYDGVHPRFPAGRPVNISRTSNVINLESTGAIVQGSTVKIDTGTVGGVAQSMGFTDGAIGHSIDGATAAGQFVRVYLNMVDLGPQRAIGEGVLDFSFRDHNLLPVQLATGASAVAPGTAMAGVDGTQEVPNVEAADNNADNVVGFVVDAGQGNLDAGAFVLIAQTGSVMYLTATAAFDRWTQVVVDQANAGNVTVATAGRTIVGWALDKATANDTVRIKINAPSFATAA